MNGPEKIEAWAEFLKKIRGFLDGKGYLEVATNHLVSAGAFESTLDCLKVTWSTGSAELHTSPEIEMKRLLAANRKSIYQICRSFRDDPDTPIHKVEFTMLEFYRMGFSLRELVGETLDLFEALLDEPVPSEEYSVTALLKESTGLDVLDYPDAPTFFKAAKTIGFHSADPKDSWEDLFFKLVLEKVEDFLPRDKAVVLVDYPARVSPLSRADRTGKSAERFEIYWHGMEIANGCTELWSAAELKTRYEKESLTREAVGKKRHPYPETLIQAATENIGLVSGVAIGMERLFLGLETSL